MAYDRITGRILGFLRVDCRYTEGRWRWLPKLMHVGDALRASAPTAAAGS